MELQSIPWQESDAPIEPRLRRTLAKENFEVAVWHDRCSARYAPHSHPCDESLWVLHGSIVLQVEGERHPLGPGDRLMLPKGTRHSAEVGPEGATYLIGQRR
jgi:quercetin dioxygenase-like cupin family protein